MAQRVKKIAEDHSHHDCEFRQMLSRVGDKWSLLVLFILKGRPAFRGRFSDLKRAIPGISQRMLTATVRNLERDGMLTRPSTRARRRPICGHKHFSESRKSSVAAFAPTI